MSRDVQYLNPFPEASMAAYLNWLEIEWSKYSSDKLDVVLTGSLSDLRKIQDQTREIALPLLKVVFARFEMSAEKGAFARKYNTLTTAIDRAKSKARMRVLIPIKLGFMTQLVTNDIRHVYAYVQMLTNSQPGPSFYLEDDTGFRIESRVVYDSTFDIPQADSASPGDQYLVEVPAYVTTYSGASYDQGLIKKIHVNLVEGTGSTSIPTSLDVKEGRVADLKRFTLNYTDPFDKTSPQWRDHNANSSSNN